MNATPAARRAQEAATSMLTPLLPDQAAQTLLKLAVEPKTLTVNLEDALGYVLAEDVSASLASPPFDRSPYDGYALRAGDIASASADAPVELRVIECVPAGHVPQLPVGSGETTKIMTGAPMPAGADCVVKKEDVEAAAGLARFFQPLAPGKNVIPAGAEYPAGTPLLARGTRIGVGERGVMACQGRTECLVCLKPRAVVIPTGDELALVGQPLPSGKIYDSGSILLQGMMERLGFSCERLEPVQDDPEEISLVVAAAMKAFDVVITTGGASVGDKDFAPAVIRDLGLRPLFQRVQMRPGGAMLAAANPNDKALLCLSGNPGAAALGLLRVALPYLHKLCGQRDWQPKRTRVVLRNPIHKASPVTRLVRGRLTVEDGVAYFEAEGRQTNASITSFCNFDLVAEVPAGSSPLAAGTMVEAFMPFREG